MNIFLLHLDPKTCARMNCDKHVVKIILEATQLLYSVWALLGLGEWRERAPEGSYRLTHKNHPISKWIRECKNNYMFVARHGMELCLEYTRRYEKIHTCQKHLEWLQNNLPENLPDGPLTQMPQAMPDQYKKNNLTGTMEDTVEAYRAYYIGEKHRFCSYKNTPWPDWLPPPLSKEEKAKNAPKKKRNTKKTKDDDDDDNKNNKNNKKKTTTTKKKTNETDDKKTKNNKKNVKKETTIKTEKEIEEKENKTSTSSSLSSLSTTTTTTTKTKTTTKKSKVKEEPSSISSPSKKQETKKKRSIDSTSTTTTTSNDEEVEVEDSMKSTPKKKRSKYFQDKELEALVSINNSNRSFSMILRPRISS